jgi:enoyl-CoA hydratase/carnithine racemase
MTARSWSTLMVQTAPPVVTIVLHRPERRNAIGPTMVNELLYALDDAFADPAVRCVVLTGSGSMFCAGGDFAQMSGSGSADSLAVRGDYADLLRTMMRAPKPIVAKVNGHALGGGLGLVAASTFAIASEDAKLGTPEVDVGLFPMMIMAVLARWVPRRRLLEMMLLGQRVGAGEAAAMGLLNRVVASSELDVAVDELVAAIASKSPTAIRMGLEAFADQDDLALGEALPMLRDRLAAILATEDAAEGLAAFMQKRPPRWTGR